MAAAPAARARSRSAAFRPRGPARIWPTRSSASPLTSWKPRPATSNSSDGIARIVGTDRTIDFSSIAKAAKNPDDLKGFGEFIQDECTYPNGTHICEVEIDPDTGTTQIVRYTIVDDFGVTVNPILLAGQVHGGVVQGIGQALTEDTIYGEDGQLLTASFMDYAMPRADDLPFFHFETRNVPSTTNALGIKGAGEAGTIGSTPAALNAVTDALWRAYGIRHIDMPATPARIWAAIQEARPGALQRKVGPVSETIMVKREDRVSMIGWIGRSAVTGVRRTRCGGEHSTLTGILLKIVSVAVFVGMSTCIKAAGDVPAGQIVFFRSFFAIFPIMAFLAFAGEARHRALRPSVRSTMSRAALSASPPWASASSR